MKCLFCSKEKGFLVKGVCMGCIASDEGDKRMEEQMKARDASIEKKRKARLADMIRDQRPLEAIMADILALKDDFTVAGQKREAELFAEKRRLSITKSL